MTSTPGLRPITEADVPAVLALNHRFVDLLSPLDAERLLWLVGLADHADVVSSTTEWSASSSPWPPGSEYDSDNYRWHALRFDDAFYYLDRIVIAEEMRRRGLAGFVYNEMEDVARRFGRMTLEVNVDRRTTVRSRSTSGAGTSRSAASASRPRGRPHGQGAHRLG